VSKVVDRVFRREEGKKYVYKTKEGNTEETKPLSALRQQKPPCNPHRPTTRPREDRRKRRGIPLSSAEKEYKEPQRRAFCLAEGGIRGSE